MPRYLKISLLTVVLLGGVFLLCWVGLRVYLSTSNARAVAASRLSEAIGLPVEVDDLNVGVSSSSLQIRVLEPASEGEQPAEILKVDSVTADVSLADLLAGKVAPTQIMLRGPRLTLEFDKAGKLRTQLPESRVQADTPIPSIVLEDGTLTLRQEGRPDFELHGLGLQLKPGVGILALGGTADDPHWGRWTIGGVLSTNSRSGEVTLQTQNAPLKLGLLQSIPFIPPATWKHVKPSGSTPATILLTAPAEGSLQYDVRLSPKAAAAIELPDAEITVGDVSGAIRIRDSRVELAGCQGHVAKGTLALDGNLNFKPEPSLLQLKVAAKGLDVRELPESWSLPKELEGKLKGHADLELRAHADGRVEPRGGGQAVLEDARIAGLPAEITFRLRGVGSRYRFEPDKSTESLGSLMSLVQVALIHQEPTSLQPKPAGQARPTTVDANLTLRDIEIAEMLEKFKVELPYKIGGKVTLKATISVPLTQATSLKLYRVRGTFQSPEIFFEGLHARDVVADVEFAEGVLKLTSLRGKIPAAKGTSDSPGEFHGTAVAAVNPRGDLTARLDLTEIPLGEVLSAIPNASNDIQGRVSGNANFTAPLYELTDPTKWVASAELRSNSIAAFGRTARNARLGVVVEKGTATLKDSKAVVEGIPTTLDATLSLVRPFSVLGTVHTSAIAATDLRRLLPEFTFPVEISGALAAEASVKGTLSPITLAWSGSVTASSLRIGGHGANRLEGKWALDEKRFLIKSLRAEIYGGKLTGSADIPRDQSAKGQFHIAFDSIDSKLATKELPDFPVQLTGLVSGEVNGTLPPSKPGQPRVGTADLKLTAPEMTVQGIPAEQLTGKVILKTTDIDYELEGHALGGTFDLKGRYPLQPMPMKEQGGTFRAQNLSLRRLAAALKLQVLEPMRGTADITLSFAGLPAEGDGEIVIRRFNWGRTRLGSDLRTPLRIRQGTLELTEFGGLFAGGYLRGRGRWDFSANARSFFLITIDRANTEQLFAGFPDLADVLEGEVSVVIRGRVGRQPSGSGTITVNHGTLAGLTVRDLQVPFEWSFTSSGSGHVVVRQSNFQVAQGRVFGAMSYDWGAGSRLSGQLRFTDLRLKSLLGEFGGASIVGPGRISGRFDFSAAPFRNAADLTGTLTATLNQTSVTDVPVLRSLSPYLSPSGLVAPFDAGELRGSLSRGVFRLDRLAMSNPGAVLHGEGTITLSGRLNLDIVAQTGRVGPNLSLLQLAGLGIPAFGPVPLAVAREISDFLSNRVIRLSVLGTVRAPTVQVNTAALLSDEAIRFLVRRYTPLQADFGIVP